MKTSKVEMERSQTPCKTKTPAQAQGTIKPLKKFERFFLHDQITAFLKSLQTRCGFFYL